MAQCIRAENLRHQDGAWPAMQLAAHAKRCLLCQLIKVESQKGGIPVELVKKYNLYTEDRPKDAWTGRSARKIVVVDEQQLFIKE